MILIFTFATTNLPQGLDEEKEQHYLKKSNIILIFATTNLTQGLDEEKEQRIFELEQTVRRWVGKGYLCICI